MGTTACRRKRMAPEGVYGVDPRDPRDTARTKLVESRFPVMQYHISRPRRLGMSATVGIWRGSLDRQNLPAGGRGEEIPLKGTDGMPKWLRQ